MSPDRLNAMVEKQLNQKFDHTKYGLKPKHRFTQQHPMANDELAHRIASGTLGIKPDIKRFTRTGVEFSDGTIEDDIDVILYGTGYKFSFPFLSEDVVKVGLQKHWNVWQKKLKFLIWTANSFTNALTNSSKDEEGPLFLEE